MLWLINLHQQQTYSDLVEHIFSLKIASTSFYLPVYATVPGKVSNRTSDFFPSLGKKYLVHAEENNVTGTKCS
jgi:hypothetical protein